MALKYCIPAEDMAKAKQAIKEKGGWGAIARLSDKDRIVFFESLFGKGVGADMNADFTKNCVLPLIKASLKTWGNKVDGKKFNKYGLADFVKKVDGINDMAEISDSPFLTMMAEVRLGYRLNNADMVAISEKVAKLNEALDKIKAFKDGNVSYKNMDYNQFMKLIQTNAELKAIADELVKAESEFQKTYNEIESKTTGDSISEVAKLTAIHKNTIGSADVSASLRQLLFYHIDNLIPFSKLQAKNWWSKVKESLSNLWTGQEIFWGYLFKGKNSTAMTEARRQIIANPLCVNGTFKRAGLDIGVTEENYPSGAMAEIATTEWKDWADYIKKPLTEAEKLPHIKVALRAVLGTVAKATGLARVAVASELAFTTQVQLARANMFSTLYEELGGEDGSEYLKEAGGFVNQQTGRGASWGEGPIPRATQASIWSTRWISARVQELCNVAYVKSETLLKQADKKVAELEKAKSNGEQVDENELNNYKEIARANKVGSRKFESSAKFLLTCAIIAGISQAIKKMFDNDDDRRGVVLDPLSTDFMKLRWDRLHIDFTGGTAKFVVAASRLITGLKTDSTGAVVKQDRIRGLVGEIENKSSPTFATLVDLGRWFEAAGKDKTAKSYGVEIGSTQWFVNQMSPIPVANVADMVFFKEEDEPVMPQVWATVADFFGIGAANYEIAAQKYKSDYVVIEEQKVVKELNWEKDLKKGAEGVPSSELSKSTKLYKELSPEDFEKAQEEFGKEWAKEEERLMKSAAYKRLPAKEKFLYLKEQRTELIDKYNAKYKSKMKKKK